MSRPQVPTEPRVVVGDAEHDAVALLAEAQLLALRFPTASQAVIRALIAEGRRFANTPEGARWRRRLSRSGVAHRGRVLWESTTLGMFEDEGDAVLPSAIVDALVTVLASHNWRAFVDTLKPNLGGTHEAAPE